MWTQSLSHIYGFVTVNGRLKDEDEGRPLPPRSAFLYDALTREEWRGQGVYQALISRSVEELISRGYENLYLMMSDRNLPAQHAAKKLGFRPTEHYIRLYRFFTVLNFQRDRVTFIDGC
jgi:GNAT superfamily N-acetyltransferase